MTKVNTKRKTSRAAYFKRLMKWVDALESGKYTQTKGILKDAYGGFCCLGVACDVSGLGVWNKDCSYLNEYAMLPDKVVDYFGLEDSTGFEVKKGSYIGNFLPDLNDGVGLSFKQIAKYVRKWAKDKYGPKSKS